ALLLCVTFVRPCLPVFLSFFSPLLPTTEIYTLSLHDALPISCEHARERGARKRGSSRARKRERRNARAREDSTSHRPTGPLRPRSEEHTSELQSRFDLVCRLLLEKKKSIRRLTKYTT